MKKLLFVYTFFSLLLFASDQTIKVENSTTKIINSAKKIELLNQKITSEYLYIYHNPNRVDINSNIRESIDTIEKDLRLIAKNTDSLDIKNILDFLSYNKDKLKNILDQNISDENLISILDISETLSEGIRSILDTYNYQSLDKIETQIHLMKIFKLYLMANLGINQTTNQNELKKEIEIVEETNKNSRSWSSIKVILESQKEYFAPNILYILIKDIQKSEEI